jgi:hypothetical protein
MSFKLIQIGVERRMTQRTTHGNDLAFVVKGMGQDMMKDERRSTVSDVPIGEMKFCLSVEPFIGQVRQIGVGPLTYLLLQESRIGDGGAFLRVPVDVRKTLKRVDPKSFAVEDMNSLFAERAKAEVGQFFHIVTCGDCGQVLQDKIEAGVGPAMEFPNAVEGKHCSLLTNS